MRRYRLQRYLNEDEDCIAWVEQNYEGHIMVCLLPPEKPEFKLDIFENWETAVQWTELYVKGMSYD